MKCNGVGCVVLAVVLSVLEVQSFLNNECAGYSSYNSLVNLIRHDRCLTMDSVFNYLKDVTARHGNGHCRISAIQHLAGHFGRNATNGHCGCSGNNTFQKYEHDSRSGDHLYCLRYDAYKDLYNQFFINDETHTISDCRTHHSVWYTLNRIEQQERNAGICQKDLVYHISNAIHKYGDPCSCSIPCSVHSSYNKLMNLADTDACMSVNSVWHILDDLEVKSPVCRMKAQQHLQDKFRHDKSSHCLCTARHPLKNENIQRISNGSISSCEHSDAYRGIEHQFFSNIRHFGCQDHRQLWSLLENVSPQQGVDCQKDLIIRTAVRFPSANHDSCSCSPANNIPNSTPQTIHSNGTVSPTNSIASVSPTISTTIVSPTISTTIVSPTNSTVSVSPTISTTVVSPTNSTVNVSPTISTTIVSPTNSAHTTTDATSTKGVFTATTVTPFLTCNKLTTIESIAKAVHVTYPNSSFCDPDAGGSDDDFTRTVCHLTSPTTWKKGMSVMDACKTPHVIPLYTSIATFTGDAYSSNGGQSGVFVKCEENGFSMAVQRCNGVPNIVHIDTNGVLTSNPYNYYTIS